VTDLRAVAGIAVAGALGAVARYVADTLLTRRLGADFPWAILAVNVSGAYAAGVLFVVLTERAQGPGWLRLTLTVGLLGGFTTFSTLSLQTTRLLQEGQVGAAAGNGLGSLALGVLAVYAGMAAARAI
jgi:CrcB protein